uniref:ATPase, T2SS/T4P/T4SS family n=1 Tax=Vibrio cholerae TaxID=666 RepID=UPI000AFA5D75
IELLFFNKYKGKGCFVTVEDPVEYLISGICPSCKVSFVDERYQRAVFSANENGCEACNHSGFKGRLLLLETLVPTVEDLELVASENW